MAKTAMPIGKPVAFEGNIRNIDPKAYGFFYCKITSPEYLEHPLLQRRIKTSNGMRTIAGLGSWEGWIFSTEMDNAVKYGYTFTILKGYQFNKGKIFTKYVNDLYQLRLNYPKSNPMNYICKLLLNSLYGKFGMKTDTTEIEVFDTSTEVGKSLYNNKFVEWGEGIKDLIIIDQYKILVRNSLTSHKYNEQLDIYHGQDVNIAIASAITSCARVHMSQLKNNPNYKLYYSDTDNIVIDRPLPKELIGDKLGQLKLEHTIKKAIFLAPKVYGLLTLENKQIIKVKGVTFKTIKELNINNLEDLLIENTELDMKQNKWFKKVLEGNISIDEIFYKLKVTSNKRENIYENFDDIKIFTSTKPYNYDERTKN